MSGARVQLVRGYVLHARAWRNTSMLVEAFTRDAGRVGLVARGVRRAGSRTRAALEPFQPLLLSWSGRGELRTLSGVEPEAWRAAPGGRALIEAYYCSELVLRLIGREDPNPEAFDAYEAAVTGLAGQGDDDPATLRRFELRLLEALGFAPALTVVPDTGEPVIAGREYDFLADHGPVPAAGPASGAAIRAPGEHLLALAAGQLDDPGVRRTAQRVLRASLAPLLGSRPLHSRELYRAMYGGARQ